MKRFNLPTWLTLSRIAMTPVIIVLLYFPNAITYWAAALLYVAASISDFVDGHLARKNNQVTSFGKFLDPLADKVLNCSMLIMMVKLGWVPAFVVIIIVCRELLVTGLRAIASDEGYVMGADRFGKLKTIFQGLAIIPLTLHHYEQLYWPGHVLLYIALALTIFSGYNYFWSFYWYWSQERPADSDSGEGPTA